jgi:hypothetical protein
MENVKSLNMSQLIAEHNRLAEIHGVSAVDSFKGLAAARAAVSVLQNKGNTPMSHTETPFDGATTATETTTEAGTPGKAKYSTVGKRGPNQGIGAYSKERIAQGASNAEILAEINEKFPGAKTTGSCIAFYRNAMKKVTTPDPEKLRAEAAKLMAAAAAAEAAKVAAEAPAPV